MKVYSASMSFLRSQNYILTQQSLSLKGEPNQRGGLWRKGVPDKFIGEFGGKEGAR